MLQNPYILKRQLKKKPLKTPSSKCCKKLISTFQFTAHVFFDDAFQPEKDNKKEINIYVKTFIRVLSEACR